MNAKRRYAGPGPRGGVAVLRRGLRPNIGTVNGKALRGNQPRVRCRIFVPVALDRNGRKALAHLFRTLGLGWDVAERFGDVSPGCHPSADENRRRFKEATAFRVWGGGDALAELERHRYCRRMTDDTTGAEPGGRDRTKLAPLPFSPGPAREVRETREEFAARWETACQWAESTGETDDDSLDAIASACCDYLASHDTPPASLANLIAWAQQS